MSVTIRTNGMIGGNNSKSCVSVTNGNNIIGTNELLGGNNSKKAYVVSFNNVHNCSLPSENNIKINEDNNSICKITFVNV